MTVGAERSHRASGFAMLCAGVARLVLGHAIPGGPPPAELAVDLLRLPLLDLQFAGLEGLPPPRLLQVSGPQ